MRFLLDPSGKKCDFFEENFTNFSEFCDTRNLKIHKLHLL